MIVGSYFDGDDDTAVAWAQYDVYGEALRIVCSACSRFAEFARRLLGDSAHADWGAAARLDHRTLQGAHDLLAAAWRFRHDFSQGRVVLDESESPVSPASAWLEWLHAEVASWIERPELVRSVLIILSNQNQPAGDQAESNLCLGIMDRFHDVPWRADLCAAYEADLSRDSQRLLRSGGKAMGE